MLFVEKYDKLQVTVEVTKQVDGKITEKVKSRKLLSTDYNDPRSPSFERFLSTIQHIDEKDTRIVEFADADKEVGPELELKSATELRQLAAVHAAGLKIEPVKNAAGVVVDSTRYRVVKPGQKYWAYCLERFDPNSLSCRYALHPNIVGGGSEAVRSLASQGIHLFGLKIVPAVGQNPADVEADVEKRIQALRPGDSLTIDAESKEFYHRSPDAMIRYLGRLVGCQLRPGEYKGQTAEQCQAKTKRGDRFFTNDEPALFLVLSTDKKDGPKALEVEYGGGRFYVPANAKDRGFTLAVLGLVNQLISMQKKSDELPKTLAVQSVGG